MITNERSKTMLSETLKLGYVHIPKCAGTSICSCINRAEPETTLVGHENWQSYQKFRPEYYLFAVIRDPVDRFVSCYQYARMTSSHWHNPIDPHPDFELVRAHSLKWCVNHFDRLRAQHWSPQSEWIFDTDDTLKVDKIVKMEFLHQQWEWFMDRFNLGKLPMLNASPPYLKSVPTQIRAKIYDIYARDYDLLGY